MIKPPRGSIIERTSFRVTSYGAIGAQIAIPRFFVISEATYPIQRILISRCSLEKPSSEERCFRTKSPFSSLLTAHVKQINQQNVGNSRLWRIRDDEKTGETGRHL